MKNSIRSLVWVDYLIDIITNPRELALKVVSGKNKVYFSTFLLPALSSCVFIIVTSLLFNQSHYFYYKISYGWMLLIILSIVYILLFSAIIDQIFQFKGKPGNVKRIINIINMSCFPVLFVLPLMLLVTSINFLPFFLLIILLLVVLIWSVFISARGFAEIYEVELASAILIYMVPHVALFVINGLISILFIFLLSGLAVR